MVWLIGYVCMVDCVFVVLFVVWLIDFVFYVGVIDELIDLLVFDVFVLGIVWLVLWCVEYEIFVCDQVFGDLCIEFVCMVYWQIDVFGFVLFIDVDVVFELFCVILVGGWKCVFEDLLCFDVLLLFVL